MLIHICCSIDSHYFLQKLQKDYPNEELIGFFYNPNIHPYLEYRLRLIDVQRSCKILNIKLIEGDYDFQNWLKITKGLEEEPEKGSRCSICFDRRFEITAKKAFDLNQKKFTSTLLMSPKKSIQQLKDSGLKLEEKFNLEFITPDYRKKSGTQEQNILAKENNLYRQDYCGCIFGLIIQREHQKKTPDELFSPISKQIQPNSLEDKIYLYEKRLELENKNISYKIIKEYFLNWKLLRGLVKTKKEIIISHILPYSTLKNGFTRGRISFDIDKIYHMDKESILFITLEKYNELSQRKYKNIHELIKIPPSFDTEVSIRNKISINSYNLNSIFIVEKIPQDKLEILLNSITFNDTRRILVNY